MSNQWTGFCSANQWTGFLESLKGKKTLTGEMERKLEHYWKELKGLLIQKGLSK